MDSFASMKKKAVAMFLGAALAAVVSFVGAGGCDEVQNTWNCSDLCNRYQDCFDSAYDTGACTDRCEDLADANQNLDDVCRTLAGEYPDAPAEMIRADVAELLEELEKLGLVVPADASARQSS